MDIVEKRIVCTVCFRDEKIILFSSIKALDIYYYNHLKKYNLLQLCEHCFHHSYTLFKSNLDNFMDWLDENDNRTEEEDEYSNIYRLREEFNLSVELLEEDPDKYLENLEKYTAMLENKIITESIKL